MRSIGLASGRLIAWYMRSAAWMLRWRRWPPAVALDAPLACSACEAPLATRRRGFDLADRPRWYGLRRPPPAPRACDQCPF